MNNSEDPREQKLSGGDIHIGEQQHGKLYRWFDNFWYHHKWKTLLSLFLVVVILVGVLQMCRARKEQNDLDVLCAGPYGFFDNEQGLNALTNCLSLTLPEDYDGKNGKRVGIISYTVYSEEDIAALISDGYDEVSLRAVSTDGYQSFNEQMITGETLILFLSPYLFEQCGERLADISEILGKTPDGSVTVEGRVTGVRLSETALYRDNLAMHVLPADTVLCFAKPTTYSNDKEYDRAVAYFGELVK